MGVNESHPRSKSIFLRLKLSTITTSCPRSDRYSEVGHPQNPSPPNTITFFFSSSPFRPFSPACRAKSKALKRVCDRLVNDVVGEKARVAEIQTATVKAVQVIFIMMMDVTRCCSGNGRTTTVTENDKWARQRSERWSLSVDDDYGGKRQGQRECETHYYCTTATLLQNFKPRKKTLIRRHTRNSYCR